MDISKDNFFNFLKKEFKRHQINVFEHEFFGKKKLIAKTKSGGIHELFLQPINLEKERSVKIQKQDLGEPKDNLWIALILYMTDMEPVLYLIPSKKLNEPDDYIFIDNEQGERFKHLSNWEIKVFTKAIPELSKYHIDHMVKEF